MLSIKNFDPNPAEKSVTAKKRVFVIFRNTLLLLGVELSRLNDLMSHINIPKFKYYMLK